MKGLKRWVVMGFAFLFAAGLALTVNAEDNVYLTNGKVLHGRVIETLPNGSVKIKQNNGTTVTYKKAHIKKITHSDSTSEKKVEHKKSRHHEDMSSPSEFGLNVQGRPGYFLSDVASTPNRNQIVAGVGGQFDTRGSVFNIPFGVAYGITDKIQVNASSNLVTATPSGLGYFTFGGKYVFKQVAEHLDIAAGIDFSLVNLNYAVGGGTFNFDPYGIATYTFSDGLQLNGELGIEILGGTTINNPLYGYVAGAAKTISAGGGSYVQCNLGAAYPLPSSKWTGIAELGINELASGDTPAIVGARTSLGDNWQVQGYGGLDFGPTVGAIFGADVAFLSK